MNPETIQDSTVESIRSLKDSAGDGCETLKAKIRENPLATVAIVALAAIFFPFRAVTGLVAVLVQIVLLLLRPALLVLGIWKSVEIARAAKQDPAGF